MENDHKRENGNEKENIFTKISDKLKDLKDFLKPKYVFNDQHPNAFGAVLPFKNLGNHKFHLRILNDGRGILIVDAHFTIYLNHSAMMYLHQFIDGKSIEEIQKYFTENYDIKPDQVKIDFDEIMETIKNLITIEDTTPINEIGCKIKSIGVPEFPLRADLAITYKSQGVDECYQARKELHELDTAGMKKILDKLWDIGIPNIIFSGGEPTVRSDLIELLTYSQNKGFVTGLITNGIKFSDENLVKTAIKECLDHVQITIHSHDRNVHNKLVGSNSWDETVKAIMNFEKNDIYFMTRTTLNKLNIDHIEDTVQWLAKDLRVKVIAINALINFPQGTQYKNGIPENELENLLTKLFSLANSLKIEIKFHSPNQDLVVNPIEVGFGPIQRTAALTSIGIEPNGDVIPCFGYFDHVGNILKDSWDKMWKSRLFNQIRKSQYVSPKADEIDLLTVCSGGSPIHIE
jgi:radical SAM protein with 4Fe4S-binding SPASM domain